MATATLLSQRARPRCCGRGHALKALLEAVWHGFPASAATKLNEAAPRVSTPRRARRTGGKKVVRATLYLSEKALARIIAQRLGRPPRATLCPGTLTGDMCLGG